VQRANYAEHELWRDVSRPLVDDSTKGRTGGDASAVEAEVMGHDDAALVCRGFENVSVRPTDQAFFNRRAEVATAPWEAFHKVWCDVLVDQEWKKSSGFTP